MKDLQNSRDHRNVPIRKVGIKQLEYPVTVLDRAHESQESVASINMYVDLPHDFKGTHMSRFVEIINEHRGRISVKEIGDILKSMLSRLDCENAHFEIRFPYFIERTAPHSKAKSLMSYECAILASMQRDGDMDSVVEARVPVTMVCPCSREISERGAHNQRAYITIRVRSRQLVWLEELIEIAEASASAPVFALLKRSDEKVLTEKAYDAARFAEDAVRGAAERLRADKRITWYEVESENMESIHNHNAYAMVVSDDAGVSV